MFLLATLHCMGSRPWFSDMWCRKEERRGLILQSVWAFRLENYIWGLTSQVTPRDLGAVMESAFGGRSSCPEGSSWSECLAPPGTSEDMGQHRGEKRTDRCHQALLQRWAPFTSPNASHPPWSNSYQFLLYYFYQPTYLFLLMEQMMNLGTLNWVGDIPERVGNSWLEKPCITVSQWMHTKGRISQGRGVFSVLCGCVRGNNRQELKLLYDSWDLPTRGSHAGQLILWKQNTAEGTQGHSHSNSIISVSAKVRHRALKQSLQVWLPTGVCRWHDCPCPGIMTDNLALICELLLKPSPTDTSWLHGCCSTGLFFTVRNKFNSLCLMDSFFRGLGQYMQNSSL